MGHNLESHVLWKNGDIEAGFQKAARVFEHTFRTPLSHHGYIEPCACTVHVHDDGSVEVWPSNKGPWGLRDQMAEDFGVPKEKIKIYIVHVGGDFGAKAWLIDVPVAYYLSKATKRPVKLVFDYTDELLAGGHRHPAVLSLRTGVDQDGNFTAVKATIHFSGGAYGAQKANPQVTVLGGRRLASMYRCPAIHVETFCAYTNRCRAPRQGHRGARKSLSRSSPKSTSSRRRWASMPSNCGEKIFCTTAMPIPWVKSGAIFSWAKC